MPFHLDLLVEAQLVVGCEDEVVLALVAAEIGVVDEVQLVAVVEGSPNSEARAW